MASFFGIHMTGYLGNFHERMPGTQCFWLMTAIGVGAALLPFAMGKPLARAIAAAPRAPAPR